MKKSNDIVVYHKDQRIVISKITEEMMLSFSGLVNLDDNYSDIVSKNYVDTNVIDLGMKLLLVEIINSFPPVFSTNYTDFDFEEIKSKEHGLFSIKPFKEVILSKGPGTVIWINENAILDHTTEQLDALVAHEFYALTEQNEKSYFSKTFLGYDTQKPSDEYYVKQLQIDDLVAKEHGPINLLVAIQRNYINTAKHLAFKITGKTDKKTVRQIYDIVISNPHKASRLGNVQSLAISTGSMNSAAITTPGLYKINDIL